MEGKPGWRRAVPGGHIKLCLTLVLRRLGCRDARHTFSSTAPRLGILDGLLLISLPRLRCSSTHGRENNRMLMLLCGRRMPACQPAWAFGREVSVACIHNNCHLIDCPWKTKSAKGHLRKFIRPGNLSGAHAGEVEKTFDLQSRGRARQARRQPGV